MYSSHRTESSHLSFKDAPETVPRRILLWLLQVFAAIAAVIFGAFTVLGWDLSKRTVAQTDVGNVVAFLSFCNDVANQRIAGNMVRTFNILYSLAQKINELDDRPSQQVSAPDTPLLQNVSSISTP